MTRHAFDQFYLEYTGSKKILLYRLDSEKGLEHTVLLKPKNAVERFFSSDGAKDIPNIILSRAFSRLKFVLMKEYGGFYQFALCSWIAFTPIGRVKSYFYVEKSTAEAAFRDIKSD